MDLFRGPSVKNPDSLSYYLTKLQDKKCFKQFAMCDINLYNVKQVSTQNLGLQDYSLEIQTFFFFFLTVSSQRTNVLVDHIRSLQSLRNSSN